MSQDVLSKGKQTPRSSGHLFSKWENLGLHRCGFSEHSARSSRPGKLSQEGMWSGHV